MVVELNAINPTLATGQMYFSPGTNDYGIAEIERPIIRKQQLFKKQRNSMLINFRKYCTAYRKRCPQLNKAVAQYNMQVDVFIEQNNLHTESQDAQAQFEAQFHKASISIDEYNKAVMLENNKQGKLLLKCKRHIPVPKSFEHTFVILIYKYAMQIDKKNNMYESVGATTTRALQRLQINFHELSTMNFDKDIDVLPYCKKTIQNHVDRFVEAGILIDYSFHGNKKPVQYLVNNQILEIYDAQNSKTLKFDNQAFNTDKKKDLRHKEIVTRTIINKKEIIASVDNNTMLIKGQIDKLFDTKAFSNENESAVRSYQNTNPANDEKTTAPKENHAEILGENSSFLYDLLEDKHVFVNDLREGKYDRYRFTIRKQLEREALHGQLTKEEFREVLIQTFIKLCAPIWKNATPYKSSWYKAYNLINDQFILTNNNYTPSKTVAMYMFDNLVYRITFAKRYFNKFDNYNPLFPSEYFDPTRKSKKSGGFAYTLNVLIKHQQYQQNKDKKTQRQNLQAQKRNKRYHAIELIEKKLQQLKNGRTNINEVHNYVSTNANIPYDIAKQLPIFIQRTFKA